jgi:hypothetical protein
MTAFGAQPWSAGHSQDRGTSVMPEETALVAVHRWFAKGEGWAYHPDLGDKLQLAIGEVADHLKSSKINDQFVLSSGRGTLVGEKFPDDECNNPRALNRHPFILRLAFLNERSPDKDTIKVVRERLTQLALPTEQGESDDLAISLLPDDPLTIDSPPEEARSHGAGRGNSGKSTARTVSAGREWSHEQDIIHELNRKVMTLESDKNKVSKDLDRVTAERNRARKECNEAKVLIQCSTVIFVITILLGDSLLLLEWMFGNAVAIELFLAIALNGCAFIYWFWIWLLGSTSGEADDRKRRRSR